ncbi:hypothetical protein E2C01_063817 [Portunus trituberculatus]|uniref:Uncharacterized protein n=1 Tax=Portunus trituberculatus TaxID=210409 RepID=A0A5B7HK19_PORTR|nr:hypothetical protein [Portunus trituberculatus]
MECSLSLPGRAAHLAIRRVSGRPQSASLPPTSQGGVLGVTWLPHARRRRSGYPERVLLNVSSRGSTNTAMSDVSPFSSSITVTSRQSCFMQPSTTV